MNDNDHCTVNRIPSKYLDSYCESVERLNSYLFRQQGCPRMVNNYWTAHVTPALAESHTYYRPTEIIPEKSPIKFLWLTKVSEEALEDKNALFPDLLETLRPILPEDLSTVLIRSISADHRYCDHCGSGSDFASSVYEIRYAIRLFWPGCHDIDPILYCTECDDCRDKQPPTLVFK